jgi:protein-L-isoaspartate(D-aspartate) O-methyltransferase
MQGKHREKKAAWLVLFGLLLFSAAPHVCQGPAPSRLPAAPLIQDSDTNRKARELMVQQQIASRGVHDQRVLEAMRKVPRHLFVPLQWRPYAYMDSPLPIGYEQTISQPYIVGFMTEALKLKPGDRVLEIGTGSGYQTAVLADLVRKVYSIEIVKPLAIEAAERLRQLGYANVTVRAGDGYRGWAEAAPFDAIMVTAATGHVPQPLLDQLAPDGRLILPVGNYFQSLMRIQRTSKGFKRENLLPVRFVPMTGEAEK